jgi:hypothetical protein
VVSAIVCKVQGCAPSTRRHHGAFAAATPVALLGGDRSAPRSRLAGARKYRLATRRCPAALPGLPPWHRSARDIATPWLAGSAGGRRGARAPTRPSSLQVAPAPFLVSVHRGGAVVAAPLWPAVACRPASGSWRLGWRRPGRRSAALLCAIRQEVGRSPRATRTVAGVVHRPDCRRRPLLDLLASARNGFEVRWLPGCSVGGTVSAAPTALDARALGLWFSVSEVGRDVHR